MSISNNLLYLLLLYAVLDGDNKLTTTNGILLALGIMLFGYCRTAINACCADRCGGAGNLAAATAAAAANPFQAVNNIL